MSARVAIAIASYNHADYVAQAIRSVHEQTHRDWRLLVIDDGSQDDSAERIEALRAQLGDERITFRKRENRGLCRTLNEALAEADAPFFCYLGSDDYWHPRKLEMQLTRIGDAAAAYSDCWVVDEAGASRRFSDSTLVPYHGGDIYRDLVFARFMPPSPTNLFSTQRVREVGGFDEGSFLEDRDLWLRISRGRRVVYVPEPLAYYRVHESNVSTANVERMYQAFEYSLDKLLREDPTLRLEEPQLRARNLARWAADEYNQHHYGVALRLARRALFRSPGDRLAWKVSTRALLKQALEWLR